jgi:hypothetical protein
VGGQAPRPGCFTPRKDPVPIVQEAGWAPGPVWTGAENPTSTGIRSLHRPARSQSLYRLSYRAHKSLVFLVQVFSCNKVIRSTVILKFPSKMKIILRCLRSTCKFSTQHLLVQLGPESSQSFPVSLSLFVQRAQKSY